MADEVLIGRLGAQGDGIAENGTLFVVGALPGEVVRVIRHGARARTVGVVEPAPERVEPVCRHFGSCGGCVMQHAADAFVAEWKLETLRATLAARGISEVPVREIATSPPGARRRLVLTARRTKKSHIIGFHEGMSDTLVGIEECPVADPALVAAIPRLGELIERAASRKGALRITLTASEGGVEAALEGAKPLDGPGRALLAGVAARASLARLAIDGEEVVTIKDPVQVMGRARVVPPPGGFLQATREGEAALAAAVAEAVGGAARVIDLFAGSGTFALRLAERAEVHAVEGEAAALGALDAAWRTTHGLKKVTTERRNLFHRPLLPGEWKGWDAAVIDPPRAGAKAQMARLAEAVEAGTAPARLAMASCNPATFARDARTLLDAGYLLDWIKPIDQFRWSAHLELVGAFRLA